MLTLEQSTFGFQLWKETQPCETGGPQSWRAEDKAKLLPILNVVENHLRQLVCHPGRFVLIDPVFRAMSGVYRYAAQRGMDAFCNLAYEVAQAFDPAQHKDPKATRRVAFLALVAMGQMRGLLSSVPEEEENQRDETETHMKQKKRQETLAHEKMRHAKAIMVGLLTKW